MAWIDIEKDDPLITLVQTTDDHLIYLANHIDYVDISEIHGSTGDDVLTSLRSAHDLSQETTTVLRHGEVIGVFGLAMAEDQQTGYPWGFFTANLRKLPALVLRSSLSKITQWNELIPSLVVYVLNVNVRSIKYLEWLGFQSTGNLIDGQYGTVFMEYERCVTQQ